ncbi:hypothetical protein [Anaerofustis stercorihominis]|uniref:hypothetical protein n=1 Tax=Anaerofustis stercorihominis TaxID=214853 RepID=UPI00214B1324|nr:hypothetical protein [Anaerofustis stercorihominis]MCR2032008.1 hypothetical protein [Anaerofustis stercorihominis]
MKINADNSYKLIKEEVNNTYEVLKDGLSMGEITDILLHDPKHPVMGMHKLFMTIAIANLEARKDIMEDRVLTKAAIYMDYFDHGGKMDEFFMTKQDLLYDDLEFIKNKYLK